MFDDTGGFDVSVSMVSGPRPFEIFKQIDIDPCDGLISMKDVGGLCGLKMVVYRIKGTIFHRGKWMIIMITFNGIYIYIYIIT
jgi:hypothetical protein